MHRKGLTGRFTFQAIFAFLSHPGVSTDSDWKEVDPCDDPFSIACRRTQHRVPASEVLQVTAALGSSSFHAGVSRDHAVGEGFLATCLALQSSSQCGDLWHSKCNLAIF